MQTPIDEILAALVQNPSLSNREDFQKLKNAILAKTQAKK